MARRQRTTTSSAPTCGIDGDASELLADLRRFKESAVARKEDIAQALSIKRGYDSEVADLNSKIADAQQRLGETPVTSASVERLKEQLSQHNVRLPPAADWLAGRFYFETFCVIYFAVVVFARMYMKVSYNVLSRRFVDIIASL